MINRRSLVGGIIGVGAGGSIGAPRPDQHYEPPPGNAIPGARALVRAREVIIAGPGPPSSGLFVYAPVVGQNNLLASIAAQQGNDQPGNFVFLGITSYGSVGGGQFGAANLQASSLTFYLASTEVGNPYTQGGSLDLGPGANGLSLTSLSGQLSLQGAGGILAAPPVIIQGVGGQLLTLTNLISPGTTPNIHLQSAAVADIAIATDVAGDTVDRHTVAQDGTHTWGQGAAAALTSLSPVSPAGLELLINSNNHTALLIENLQANGGQSLVQLTGSTATDRALGVQISTDTNERIRLDQTPAIHLGTGTASPDCTIGRGGPDQLAMDYIAYSNNGGTVETWQAPTFANGWVNAPAAPNLQYRRVAAPYNSVQFVGRVTVPVGFAVGQAIIAAIPGAYHPTDVGDIIAWDLTAGIPVLLRLGTGGVLSYQAGAIVAGDTISIPAGNGLVSLDA